MIVQIPEYEYLWARCEARRRLSHQTPAGHALLSLSGFTPIEHEVLTVLGEVGAALALRLDYQQIPRNDYGHDLYLQDGRSIEVKSILPPEPGKFERQYPDFMIPGGLELNADYGVLAQPRRSLGTVRVVGYCTQTQWAKNRILMHWLPVPALGLAYHFLEKDLSDLDSFPHSC